ncbi:hypothetical protein ACJJTC_016334 [Scirpophaga incertulas]
MNNRYDKNDQYLQAALGAILRARIAQAQYTEWRDSSVVGSRHRRVPGHNAPQRATMAQALSAGCAQSETEARPPETIADHTSKELQVTIVRTLRGRLNTCQETGSGTLCSWKYHFLYHGTTFKSKSSVSMRICYTDRLFVSLWVAIDLPSRLKSSSL